MSDHTAEIFAALGVTPETYENMFRPLTQYTDNTERFIRATGKYSPKSLLSETLEADGLAVRLVEIAEPKYLYNSPFRRNGKWFCHSLIDGKLHTCEMTTSFAVAVHDALCEALGITEGEAKQ